MFLCSLRYCLKCYFSKGVYTFTLSTVYIYIYIYIYIYVMLKHSLSSKIEFSFNSYILYFGVRIRSTSSGTWYLSFQHKKIFLESASEIALRCIYTV